ncbi:MAG: hypothetical protein HRT66_00070 [Flavobacteriaceae bacterium]|nr:hypothetical protein [Flavobacteriaceae bacterium]
MEEVLQIANLLDKQFENFSLDYESLKLKNIELLESLDIAKQNNFRLEELLAKEREKHESLKISKTLQGGTIDVKETEDKIDALVSQIDICIDKLNQ